MSFIPKFEMDKNKLNDKLNLLYEEFKRLLDVFLVSGSIVDLKFLFLSHKEVSLLLSEYSSLTNSLRSEYNMELKNLVIGFIIKEKRTLRSPIYKTKIEELLNLDNLSKEDVDFINYSLDNLKKPSLKEINLLEMSREFGSNLNGAKDSYFLNLSRDDLKGLSDGYLKTLVKSDEGLYSVSFSDRDFNKVMNLCDSSDARERYYRYSNSICSNELDNNEHTINNFSNENTVINILRLRNIIANQYGFDTYADYNLSKGMLSLNGVKSFLDDRVNLLKPCYDEELSALSNLALESGHDLNDWDIMYLSNLKNSKSSKGFSDSDEIFLLDDALDSLYSTLKKLFNIDCRNEVYNSPEGISNELISLSIGGELKGYVLLDLFSRKGKRSGSYVVPYSSGLRSVPLCFMNTQFHCSNNRGINDDVYISLSSVRVLFHEMGHALNDLFSNLDNMFYSGIENVSWDSVEIQSSFLERCLYTEEVLRGLSVSKLTGEVCFDVSLMDEIISNYLCGNPLVKMNLLENSYSDLFLHSNYMSIDFKKGYRPDIYNKAFREKFGLFKSNVDNHALYKLNHIFSGGYASNYYGYAWGEYVANELFKKYVSDGVLLNGNGVADKGEYLLNVLFSQGSAVHSKEIVGALLSDTDVNRYMAL